MRKTIHLELEFEIEFDYTPEEPAVMDVNDPMCGPGYPATLCVLSIVYRGHDINMAFTAKEMEELEERLLIEHEEKLADEYGED